MLATFLVGCFVIAIGLCSPPISQGDFINSGTPAGVTLSFDCAVREYAYLYGKSMQPRHGEFVELFDALQLQACNMTRPTVTTSTSSSWKPPISTSTSTDCTFYIDSIKGNDNNDGSINSPLQTIQKGIIETRRNRSSSTALCTLYLRNGTFYVSNSILLTSQDSYLTISNYMNEKVTISGGVPLQYADSSWSLVEYEPTSWKIYNNSNNCWGRSGVTTSNDLIRWFGTFTTLNDCIDSIKSAQSSSKYGSFYGLCWNDPSIDSPDGGQCYGIHDISFQPQTESKIYSARFEGRNIWSIKIQNVEEIGNIIPGLRVNEKRGIRARYPDQITETAMQFDPISGWIPYRTKWEPPTKYAAPKNVIYTADSFKSDPNVEWPMKIPGFNDTDEYTGMGDWGEHHIGIGGTCNHPGIEPNYGYWCSADSPRGNGYQHVSPSGIYLNESLFLPNAPYTNISGAVFQAWRPDHWFTIMFDVNFNDRYNRQTGLVNFSSGGFQGGEGTAIGAEWYIENVREELTIPNEYYYNTTTNILYFYYNSTTNSKEAPPNDLLLTATHTKVLFNISGSQKDVIKNITFQGIEFRDTAYSYLDPHGMPSGGDWGLQKQGAITIEGGENIVINSSLFTRIDGNAIFIGGYNRNITISNNDFEWIGDTVIASWGYTSSPDNNTNLLPNGGPDGRNGDQPRFNHIYNNLVREIGLYQKQSSMYFQAVSCQSIIENNIFFNGPRAAVNFNDGFGGANILRYNLLINAVRESGDHGPFNSWDRVPYVTNVNSANNGGKSSIIPAFNHIYQNFVIGTYEASYCVDNDDGSSQYSTYQNFFVYGAIGMKSVFNGNTNHHYQNVYAYIDWAYVFTLNSCYRHTGSYDHFRNNSVVLTGLYTDGYPSTCIKVPGFVAYGNSLYNPSGRMEVCGTTLQKWVQQGNDPGTTINKLPTDQQIIQMAKQILPNY